MTPGTEPPPLLKSGRKPAVVGTAVLLQVVNLLLGLPRIYLERPWEMARHPELLKILPPGLILGAAIFSLGFTWALLGWLLYKTNRGRDWARITLLALFGTGLPFSIVPLLRSLRDMPVSGALGIVQLLLQIVSLCLLFGRTAKPWFQPKPPPLPLAQLV